jgi:alkylation response protein AidB-like acyl-CoA dehydrogenase
VTERVQFGKPIGSFQAVQHRLAAAYAQAMGARWLARRGAWFADDEFITASAAAYACEAAALTYQNTHQVTGAIGITSEYGLVNWTLPLLGLRQELGGQRAHARRVASARRAADKSWPTPIPLPA